MYEQHRDILTPPDDTVLWRYLDLERMVALLCSHQLHFTRLDKLKDLWEGTWPKPTADLIRDHHQEPLIELNRSREHHHVSCWHVSVRENAALWGLYGQSAGFAIKSSIGAIKSALDQRVRFYIGAVKYIDFENPPSNEIKLNGFIPVFYKRESFASEQEVRIAIWDKLYSCDKPESGDDFSPGIDLDVDLNRLIDEVYISPLAESWLVPHLKNLCAQCGLNPVYVRRSDLYDPRLY